MVKRRRLETPSNEDLSRIEEEFRRETSGRPSIGPGIAPVAQVAAETASAATAESAESRVARARDQADAERLRQAEGQGLLIVELPLEQIDEGAMIRDRMVMDEAEMTELRRCASRIVTMHGGRITGDFDAAGDLAGAADHRDRFTVEDLVDRVSGGRPI